MIAVKEDGIGLENGILKVVPHSLAFGDYGENSGMSSNINLVSHFRTNFSNNQNLRIL